MSPTVIFDVVFIALLVPTIIYAVILNRRLEALRRNRDDLGKMIAAFNEATVRAEAGIPKMRKAAQDVGNALQDSMEKAQTLRDDLAFMTERADSMANRLEGQLREARGASRPIIGVDAVQASASAPAPGLMDYGIGDAKPSVELPEPLGMDTVEDAIHASKDSRVVGGISPAPSLLSALLAEDDDDNDDHPDGDERSEAERQLLRAIQASR